MRSYLMLAVVSLTVMLVAAARSPPRNIFVEAGDEQTYEPAELNAKAGERVRLVLRSTGKLHRAEMAHDLVLLATGTDARAFVDGRGVGPVDSSDSHVIAATRRAGAGETADVTFAVPTERGRYEYLCSFPGHYAAGMKGTLIVR